jgi:hypothetical protein
MGETDALAGIWSRASPRAFQSGRGDAAALQCFQIFDEVGLLAAAETKIEN